MSLSAFSFLNKSVFEFQSWFVDILNHLGAKNYDNGTWTPIITGITGTPTITAWYQRFGIECNFTIIIDGTHQLTNATITLPTSVPPDGYGIAVMHSLTDNSTIGTARVDSSTNKLHVREYWVDNEVIILKGFYKVKGI